MASSGGVAQLGEHLLCKQGVVGSIPIVSTRVVPSGSPIGALGGCITEKHEFRIRSWSRCWRGWGGSGKYRVDVFDFGYVSAWCVIFVKVNQVLVRLWACLVAMSDRLVGRGRVIGCVWPPAISVGSGA